MKKVILYTSLILNLLLIICVFILIGSSSILSKNGLSSIQGKTDSLGVEEKRLFDEVLYDEDILFLGSNRASYCNWNSLMGVRNICNMAISSNTIEEDCNRIELMLDGKVPNQIFLMYGEVELLSNRPANDIVRDYELMISKLQDLLPQTELIVISPIPLEYYDVEGDKDSYKENFKALNLLLKISLRNKGVSFVNLINDFMSMDGFLDYNFRTKDKLKLNRKAYAIIKERISPYIKN